MGSNRIVHMELFMPRQLNLRVASAAEGGWALTLSEGGAPPALGVVTSEIVQAVTAASAAGRPEEVGDRVNPTTRRLTVRCVVANPGGRLKAEMFASVDLGAAEARPTIVVPATALQDLDGKTVVFVESTPGTFQARTVKVGAERDGQVAILEGLADGARVVRSSRSPPPQFSIRASRDGLPRYGTASAEVRAAVARRAAAATAGA